MAGSPPRVLIKDVPPARHAADRVIIGLPGAETASFETTTPTLIVNRIVDDRGISTSVPLDRPDRIERVVRQALEGGGTQVWLRDRARLWDHLGRPPTNVEAAIVRACADTGVPFVGWTGSRENATGFADAYEEVRDAYRASDLPGVGRERE